MKAGKLLGFALLSAWSVLVVVDPVGAGTPRMTRLSPPGGQRGTTVEVEVTGAYMTGPRGMLFYGSGLSVESIKPVETAIGPNGRDQAVEPGTRLRVRLKIADDCPLGAHGLRLQTGEGLTEYHRFFVGPFPTVDENEVPQRARNDKRENAVSVDANTTVFGRLNDAADLDLYRIEVKRGQRVSAEVEAARLGVERGIPDLHLAIYDADGKKLAAADDSALFVQDPVLSILAPRDGAYFVEVRHSMYNAANDAYRLHVGTFSRPTGVYPAGGQAGGSVKVQILGDPRGEREQTVRLPAEPGDFHFVDTDQDGIPTPTPNRMRVSPFPNVLESEPNDSADAASGAVAELPVAFNGIINKAGDVDCFRFKAKKGQQFRFHALANALGSPADPVIWVSQVGGRQGTVLRSADSRPNQLGLPPSNGLNRESHDPVLEFTAPADGEYVLGVEDERGEGGVAYVYRVEVSPEQNAVHAYIAPEPDNQRLPQLRQSISVASGNRTTVQVAVFNTGRPHDGDLELVAVGLPKGVTMHAPTLTRGLARVPVVFEADEGVKPLATLIDLVARPVGGKAALPGGYRQTILMNGYGNNDYYLHTTVTKLALAVAEPAPFRVEVEEPKSSLVQNGEMPLKFKVIRREGFTGPVLVQMEWRPTGLSTATPVTVSAEQSEGTYLVAAARNASAGAYQVTLTASTGAGRRGYYDSEGRTYAASQPFKLTVAEPHVEARLPRTSVERGKTTTLTCKLNHLQPISGKAKATLARLPRGVELVDGPKEISSADKEVTFTLRATSEALVGNYQGVALDLTVIENGQSVRQLSGYGLLRVDAERGTTPRK